MNKYSNYINKENIVSCILQAGLKLKMKKTQMFM